MGLRARAMARIVSTVSEALNFLLRHNKKKKSTEKLDKLELLPGAHLLQPIGKDYPADVNQIRPR